jgi:hypothetical protein
MKRLASALLVAGALVSAAGAAAPERVLAVEWRAGGGQLRWVSATTLRPVGGSVVNVGGAPVGVTAVSPDGKLAALGGGERGRLRLLDLQRFRSLGVMWLAENASVAAGLWSARDRLVLLTFGLPPEVVVVDPVARRVVERRKLPGIVKTVANTRDRLLALLAPPSSIGAASLAVIAADGSVQTVALPGIRAGFAPPRTRETPGRQASPGVTASLDGTQAAVVGLDRLALVDLETLSVRTRPLALRTPARTVKVVEGWGRGAVWVARDTIAVSGWSDSWDNGVRKHTPAGVRLVSPVTGATRLLDAKAEGVLLSGSTLLAYGGDALRGFAFDGRLRFELLEGHDTGYVQTAGRYAYVGSENATRYRVVDTRAGRVVRNVKVRKQLVILGD